MQQIRDLLLDLDDTLIDTRAAMVAAAAHAAGELWPELSADVAAEFGLLHYTDPARNLEFYADGVVTFDEMRLARYDHARGYSAWQRPTAASTGSSSCTARSYAPG